MECCSHFFSAAIKVVIVLAWFLCHVIKVEPLDVHPRSDSTELAAAVPIAGPVVGEIRPCLLSEKYLSREVYHPQFQQRKKQDSEWAFQSL